MPVAFADGAEESVQAAAHLRPGLQVRAKGKHVGMVVPAAIFCRVLAPGNGAADSPHLIRGDCNTDSAAAHDNTEDIFAASRRHRLTRRLRKVRIVRARFAVRAVVHTTVAERRQVGGDLLLELESAVVAAKVYFQGALHCQASQRRLARNTSIRLRIASLY